MFKISPKKTTNTQNKSIQFENQEINQSLKWLKISKPSQSLTDDQLVIQNRKILQSLKFMASKLTKQLRTAELKAATINLNNQTKTNADILQLLTEKVKNNQKLITALQNDSYSAEGRKQKISNGLESKTTERKFMLEKKIQDLKSQLRKMKLQEHEVEKKLVSHQNPNDYEGVQEHNRLEEQLRCFSVKYVRLLDKYNKSIQKLAVASSIDQIPDHQFQIPEQVYNQELQKRQKEQFKQYQGIVKLCTILQKRNESQHNKAHRIYNQRLKQLQRLINSLGQVDRIIAQRQGELIESRKYVDMIKYRLQTGDTQYLRQSVKTPGDMLRSKSYSTVKLYKENDQIKKRGYSFARLLPAKLNTMRQ